MTDPEHNKAAQDPMFDRLDAVAYGIILAVFGALNGAILAWGFGTAIGWRIGAAVGGALVMGGAWLIKPFRSYCSQHYRSIAWAASDDAAEETIANLVEGSLRQRLGSLLPWLLAMGFCGALLGGAIGYRVTHASAGFVLGALTGALALAALDVLVAASLTALNVALFRKYGAAIRTASLGALLGVFAGASFGMELSHVYDARSAIGGALALGLPVTILFAVVGWRGCRKRGSRT